VIPTTKPKNLLIKVIQIKGHCPIYRVGTTFRIVQGFKLLTDESLCMHSLALLMPYYVALSWRMNSVEVGFEPKAYTLATVHRAQNTDDPERLKAIFQGLVSIAQEGLPVIVPLHPRTRRALTQILAPLPPRSSALMLKIIESVSYLDMMLLEKNARVILTDSGGVQKEAFFFRVPCVTLREETEWVETVEAGWNTLGGCDPDRILQALSSFSHAPSSSCTSVSDFWPYGDGKAEERIVKSITSDIPQRN